MGNFYVKKFTTFLEDDEPWKTKTRQNTAKGGTRQVAQGKEFGNVIIDYDEIGRQN